MDKNLVQATESDGRLMIKFLKPGDEIEDYVLKMVLPLVPGINVNVMFVGMDHARAMEYSTHRAHELLVAIAEASNSIAQETEQWYALVVLPNGQARLKPQKLPKALSRAVERAGVGWVNPFVVTQADGSWLFDIALSDVGKGTAIIQEIVTSWSVDFRLVLKEDGLHAKGAKP